MTEKDAWVAMPSQEDVAAFMSDSPYNFGFIPAMARLVAAHLEIGAQFGALFSAVMFAPGSLERREREMVAAVTAAAQDCFY